MNELTTELFLSVYRKNLEEWIEKKNGLDYLPWAIAWKELKLLDPLATFKVYEAPDGFPVFLHETLGGFVKVGVTAFGIEYIETFPVMNHKNAAITAGQISATNVNTSIKRAFTKAIAHHGVGLQLYTGEVFPDEEPEAPKVQAPIPERKNKTYNGGNR